MKMHEINECVCVCVLARLEIMKIVGLFEILVFRWEFLYDDVIVVLGKQR